jgi:two-component system cell cycle response regulator DivK
VIAKAVETPAERACVESLGCDGYQGNFFSPALPRNLFMEFLKREQSKSGSPATPIVEQTQPMPSEPAEQPVILRPVRRARKPGDEYNINCFHCHEQFNANEAPWCQCLTSDPSVICPTCKKCFCRAILEYRHKFWDAAPESFWDRRRQFEQEMGSLDRNPAAHDLKRPLVLVLDDELSLLKIAKRLISGFGYSVIVGQNGQEGLRLAKQYMPDLVLSDALMPKMDGREMCAILKRDPETAKIKAVIMTAFAGAAKYKSSVIREYQFDGQLQKPVEYDNLRATLTKLLG